jgi:mannose-6-phosphate isomerase-like protein (cupin superfamily)
MKYTGNAGIDGKLTRQWIVGSFMPEGDIRNSGDVEIKWGVHQKGEVRPEWVTDEQRTTVAILVSGRFMVEFRDEEVELRDQGDYVMWGAGEDHRWRVLEDSVTLTVRWTPTIH